MQKGFSVISDPVSNLSEAFSVPERKALKIHGLMPPRVQTLKVQMQRWVAMFDAETDPMKKFLILSDLFDINVNLYYHVVCGDFAKYAPFIYTPHVGQYCLKFHEVYRPKNALYYSFADRGHMDEITNNWPRERVDIVVVTDGGRILGLGDLGVNGIGIPIGKLALYVSAAGCDPRYTLPVSIDAGTNNVALRSHPLYLGHNHPRIQGEEYFSLVEEVLLSLHKRWPEALIQFEDFGTDKAFDLLRRWQNRLLCFNDDIQGTGSVTLACLLGAMRVRGWKDLSEERIVIAGAGSAGIGISDAVSQAMVAQIPGMTIEKAREHFWITDVNGLLVQGRTDLTVDQANFARKDLPAGMSLTELVHRVHPTTLIGVTACPGIFTREIIEDMAAHTSRPLVLPMSNPTSKAECTSEQVFDWSNGTALFASGSPFPAINKGGKIMMTNQCNNMYIFPAVGLAACACKATRVTYGMLYAAALACSEQVTPAELEKGILLPNLGQIRQVSEHIAAAVILQAVKDGVAKLPVASEAELLGWIRQQMWVPDQEHF